LREYYTHRKSGGRRGLDLAGFKRLFFAAYRDFSCRGYFQEAVGYDCVDTGWVAGYMGEEPDLYALRHLETDKLWPPNEETAYSLDELFDLIEFLHDITSKPKPEDGYYHSYSDCGWHYRSFDRREGRREFRATITPLLARLDSGWELTDDGEIDPLPPPGMDALLDGTLPDCDPENVENRVRAAITAFRRRGASLDERRAAVRALTDVLEYLRPDAKSVLANKDESDLFQIVNEFSIRHHNTRQKRDYDPAVWLSWMFYFYLATIHAVLHMIAKRDSQSAAPV
jgi:hypothetical protein